MKRTKRTIYDPEVVDYKILVEENGRIIAYLLQDGKKISLGSVGDTPITWGISGPYAVAIFPNGSVEQSYNPANEYGEVTNNWDDQTGEPVGDWRKVEGDTPSILEKRLYNLT